PGFQLSLLLLTLRPPRPPLFPYTTLFRSLDLFRRKNCCRRQCPVSSSANPINERQFARRSKRNFSPRMGVELHCPRRRHWLYGQDRKSTRLNSSHVKNSYAVVCLKKKKCM